jgi:hypothetical protein
MLPAVTPAPTHAPSSDPAAAAFIERWRAADGTELSNYQLFVHELAVLLGVETPQPSREDTRDNAYVFERRVTLARGDGSSSEGRIDCYRRGAFVLEAKKIRAGVQTKGFDDALLRARSQAETYARALPADEGRPPFLLVVDVGHVIELYAEFTRSGATYTPYPDPRSHRIRLPDLESAEVRATLRAVWTDPLALDPTRRAARITREIAAQLAQVAKALEAAGHAPKRVAGFLSRCLFTMFAEDIGLLPRRAFADLLERYITRPEVLTRQLEILWQNMDRGEFSPLLETTLLKFNGKLFKQPEALPLARAQIELLAAAARADWKQVEPAIFGTLLERALDPAERHALGAHYTPRAYVERLVLPTLMEPLRADWQHVQAAALVLLNEGGAKAAEDARRVVREYLMRLCEVRVLDPACGSGNFLYVALEQMKRLEGEVLNFLDELGDTQGRLDMAGTSVDPHQLLGIELNPRAAEVAEMVLWIGYLQWHFRTRGNVNPPLPVLKDFHNIECRDAVLAYDRVEYELDEQGRPVTRWDGKTMKKHPVTGLDVPDERARVPVEKYVNPRAAEWPQADFVIGNPPFIGNKRMRIALGEGYVEALRSSWPSVPQSADLVMYWWEHAAEITRVGKLRRFGFITTNSLTMIFNRRVVDSHLAGAHGGAPLRLCFAVPDHPWVDSTDGAAVRIAMTVGSAGAGVGQLLSVESEQRRDDGEADVTLARRDGVISGDLRTGADLTRVRVLTCNAMLASRGVIPHGAGMVLTQEQRDTLEPNAPIRPYRNGRDLTERPRGVYVIDCFGLRPEQIRENFPRLYQWLIDYVKPERDAMQDRDLREKWWLHRRSNEDLRRALMGLTRYIATGQVAKHRTFQFLDGAVLPDDKLIAIGLDSAVALGVLSSRSHAVWAVATGGRLGVGNDLVYSKSVCFDRFPFPVAMSPQAERIVRLAEQIDACRKRQQAQHSDLTLTGIYNVLEKLRRGEPLTAKDKVIHDRGLVSVLRELHDELDRAVFAAYGWNDLADALVGKPGATTPYPEKSPEQAAAEEELLSRLVALNAERAAEEARGVVRWLRPEFQVKAAKVDHKEDGEQRGEQRGEQGEIDVETEPETDVETEAPAAAITAAPLTPAGKRVAWPSTLPEQIRLVADTVAAAPQGLDLDQLAAQFTGRGAWKKRLPDIVDSLAALGRVKIDRQGDAIRLHG